MPGLLAYGAGASEGLDIALQRAITEQQINETKRSNLVSEGQRDTQLKQQEETGKALADQREAAVAAREQAKKDDEERKKQEEAMLADPATPPLIKQFIGLRRITPKGENVDYHLLTEPNGPGVNSEVKPVKWTHPGATGKPVSEVVDANYNPRTQTYTYKGQDITKDVEHYEKPPAPDRVLIQTGNEYIPRADAAKKIAAGGSVPLATTSATRTMGEGASMLLPHVKDLAAQATALDASGNFGPVMSRIRTIATKVGTIDEFYDALATDPELSSDRQAGKFATSLGLMATGAGRVHGGARGGGSPQMYEHFKSMLSDASTLPMFLGRIDAVDDYMKGYSAGPGAAKGTAPAAPAAASDPYQDYLNRNKPK